MTKGRYEKRREEVLVREAEEKAKRKRYNYPSQKHFLEGIARFQRRIEEEEE